MKSLQLSFLVFLLGLLIGCELNQCEDVECGPGDCVEGICDCPDGFIGVNCEIELCFGVPCINGDCDLETETCNCNPNFYGEECNIFCANGEFVNGACNCSVGYEGLTCVTESRDRFLGWWGCEQWSWTPQTGGSPVPGFLPGSIKFECGNKIPEIELFPTENSSGLMLLNSNNTIVGLVTEKTINFELQYLTNEVSVYGTARLGDDQFLSFELYFFNSSTSTTELVKGTFTLFRNINNCN